MGNQEKVFSDILKYNKLHPIDGNSEVNRYYMVSYYDNKSGNYNRYDDIMYNKYPENGKLGYFRLLLNNNLKKILLKHNNMTDVQFYIPNDYISKNIKLFTKPKKDRRFNKIKQIQYKIK